MTVFLKNLTMCQAAAAMECHIGSTRTVICKRAARAFSFKFLPVKIVDCEDNKKVERNQSLSLAHIQKPFPLHTFLLFFSSIYCHSYRKVDGRI